tara:strand:- start:74 stop:658 length:585 start_codon:yes stop_codon:yes gene_type:complete
MSEIQANKISPATGTALQVGDSGDTITIPSGATITNNGTQTGFGGTNTPNFHAYSSSNQVFTRNTATLLKFDTEVFDTASAYNNTASNYKFVVPSAGKYFVNTQAFFVNNDAVYIVQCWLYIYKNGSEAMRAGFDTNSGDSMRKNIVKCNTMLNLAQNDYLQVYAYCETLGGSDDAQISGEAVKTFFEGYKIIE